MTKPFGHHIRVMMYELDFWRQSKSEIYRPVYEIPVLIASASIVARASLCKCTDT